jgi:predicted ArsR family transcriptional regulator
VPGRCPFRDLSEAHGRVVCGVHRSLIRGALAELGAPSEVELRPFVEPSRCLAEIRAR